MVDFNLRELSASVESLRPEVDAAYKRLDAKWDEIASELKKLPIPCAVGFTYSERYGHPEDYNRLEWKKWSGKKRICIVYYRWDHNPITGEDTEETTIPYDEWSAEQRLEMLEHVPNLFASAIEQVNEFVNKTK